MASSSSRIPKCPSSCTKRPNENALPRTQKRQRLETPSLQPGARKLQRAISTTSLNNVGRYSELTKRAVLQPQGSAENLRQSMAATTAASSIKRTPMGPPPVSKPKKVPAWDLKGRIEIMESKNNNLIQELRAYNERIVKLEEDKMKLNVDVATKEHLQEQAVATVQNLQEQLKIEKQTSDQRLQRISELEAEVKSLSANNNNLMQEVKMKEEENSSLKNLISTLTASRNTLEAELEAIRASLSVTKSENSNLRDRCQRRDTKIATLEHTVSQLELRIQEAESMRRRMHNTIQELKGNIRVFCRIRPPLPDELSCNLQMSIINIKDDCKALEIMNTEVPGRNRIRHEFSFDHVFDASSSQDDVFLEISQLVQSVLDGYNVCIFAYGQTGSGKTYTMEGPGDITNFSVMWDDARLGMIPRSVHHIFSSAEKLRADGWRYVMEASFMEIYNENIRDLLGEKGQGNNQKCEIKRVSGNTSDSYVSNVKTVEVTSETEVYDLLKTARVHRAVAATNCNERSSRSHYIFQMKLTGENTLTTQKCEGILNLVDLAGSERIKESGSSGDRLKEAKNINKSLSNLGNVIMALSQKADHVPYRNSKLTHLLMNSLGGNSKTLMFVNINPCEESLGESVNSLRFATKVNQCSIGTATKRVK